MKKIIETINLKKEYKMGEITVSALGGLNLDLYQGELVVILGPSGSGKSTLLNIIGGIDTPSSGSILYNDDEISKYTKKQLTLYRREAIGFIFQFYNLIPNLTARENILLSSNLSKNPIDVDELLEKIELSDRKNHFPAELSGGQQQRIAIARAVAKNPDILLCDEPTGALDVKTGINALSIIKDFNITYKKTVVIITHNSSIGEIADRIIYVKDGVIDNIKVNEKPISPMEVLW